MTVLNKQLGYLIARTNRLIELDLESRLKPDRLTIDHFRVLRCLEQTGPISMSELASHVLVEPANLTKIIDRMTSQGFVMRLPDQNDRRRVLVTLAPAGKQKNSQLADVAKEHEVFVKEMLGAEDVEAIRNLLADLQERREDGTVA
ncbi:MarR family winged helix-turn-helix transcriptional regulator [Pseudodonghicola flavimaris]|uniref:MarR family transcriptional regulator n=1 Tax=Pseudodonghicola flavimaris TaxID=3050036 RepID=A0ABT7F1Q4_9RHOB|nr:MarR family transcriptional regulator [Pseudodonghicola flavimaris]MDK3018536.1 MarR family transcriptional regulator [Pseudodonghicola flavimaris]